MSSDSLEPADPVAALAYWRTQVAATPTDAKAHTRLAELLYEAGETAEAIAHRSVARDLRGVREKLTKRQVPPKPNHVTEPIYAELRRIAASGRPIFVGPWGGEVGFELLYWIPFLHRFVEEHGVDPARLRVVSRGGVASWYEGLVEGDRYAELYDLQTPAQISQIARDRHLATGSDKPMAITPWDRGLAEQAFGAGPMEMLHPSLMYRLLADYWRGTAPFALFGGNAAFRRLSVPSSPALPELPERFTAVKFYSRDSFPMTPDNAAFVRDLVVRLAERGPVVVLDTGVEAYGHEDYSAPSHPNIISVKPLIQARDNLHLQSCIVARAERFVGAYGGFAYLPLLYGKPADTFFSKDGHTLIKHSQAVYLLSERMAAPISIATVDSARLTL